tara:strand:+ start:1543 stop:2337 length:795 start_codon:yes stop_codon:yes gene_type:complete
MPYKVDDLLATVKAGDGLAHANLWRVFLPPIGGVNSQDLNTLCKVATMPGRQILSTERQIGSVTNKVAYGYASEDITLTFYCLNDMRVRDYFENWQNLAFNQETQEVGWYKDYTFDVVIQTLKKASLNPLFTPKKLFDNPLPDVIKKQIPPIGPLDIANGVFDPGLVADGARYLADAVTYSTKLLNAYPTTMNSFELNNELDGLLEVNVQLSYKRYEVVEGNIKDRALEATGVKDKIKDAAKGLVKKAGARAVKTGLRKALFGI